MMDWEDRLIELNPKAILFDGLNKAVVGIGGQCGQSVCAVYDEEKIIAILAETMDYSEAEEWYETNIACAALGPHTPIIVALSSAMDPYDRDVNFPS
jgi:hypothetical protein